MTDAYLQDCFPGHQGEVSALFNFFRTMGGFAVVYFQQPWLAASGGFQVFGCEAAFVNLFFGPAPGITDINKASSWDYSSSLCP
jgi:hypothetical protein